MTWSRPGLRPAARARMRSLLSRARSSDAIPRVVGCMVVEFPDLEENEVRLCVKACFERYLDLRRHESGGEGPALSAEQIQQVLLFRRVTQPGPPEPLMLDPDYGL